MEGTAHGPSSVDPVVVGQAVGNECQAKDLDDASARFIQFGVAGTRVTLGRCLQAGVVAHHGPPSPTHGSHGGITRQTDSSLTEPSSQNLSTAQSKSTNQGVVTVDMAIEGRRAYTEVLGNPGQRDSVKAVDIGQSRRRLHDLFGVQCPTIHGLILPLETLTFQLVSVPS